MLDARTVHAKEAVEILEENFGELVFKSRIRKAIKFAEAPVRGASVLKYDPKSNAADYYRALAEEVLDPWRVRSGPACAKARSQTSSARPSIPRIRPRRRWRPVARSARARPRRLSIREEEPPATDPSPSRRRRGRRAGIPAVRLRRGASSAELRGRGSEPRAPSPRATSMLGAARVRAAARRQGAPVAGSSPTTRWTSRDRPTAATSRSTGRRPPDGDPTPHAPVIRVVGVGGAGVNAINRMVEARDSRGRVHGDQHRPAVAAAVGRRRHRPSRQRHVARARRRLQPGARLPGRVRGAGQDQAPAQGLGHGLRHRRRRRRHRHRRGAGRRPPRPRRRRAHRRDRHEAVQVRGLAPREAGRGGRRGAAATRSTR